MIALDASVLIAHMVEGDAHAVRALEILDTEEELIIHPLTLAESLVGPVRTGLEEDALQMFTRLGIERHTPSLEEPLLLARLRASTGLKLPDCCVLATAAQHEAKLATLDTRLARAARASGLDVLDV